MVAKAADLETGFRFFNEIGIIHQLSSNRFERVLPEGLSLPQFSVLNNFVRLGGTRTPAQLAAAFQVTRGAMTNTIARLEQQGCVRVEPSPVDGRSKIISITAAGRRLREKALRAANEDLEAVLAGMDVADLERALTVLVAARSYLDANRPDH